MFVGKIINKVSVLEFAVNSNQW